jgi:hypothetical protein
MPIVAVKLDAWRLYAGLAKYFLHPLLAVLVPHDHVVHLRDVQAIADEGLGHSRLFVSIAG